MAKLEDPKDALIKLGKGLVGLGEQLLKALSANAEGDDEDDEQPKKAAKKTPGKATTKLKKSVIDDDDDEDTADDEEEEETPKKKAAKKPGKKKPVDDDDDEDDEEEEDEEEPKPKKKGSKKPAKDEEEDEEEDDDESENDEDDLAGLPRVKLVPIARELGIETAGVQNEPLRDAIRKARAKAAKKGGGKPAGKRRAEVDDDDDDDGSTEPPKSKVNLRVLQDHLVSVIETHWSELESAVEELGCGGDCHNCPAPETAGDVEAQVKSCLTAVTEDLDLKLPKNVKVQLNA